MNEGGQGAKTASFFKIWERYREVPDQQCSGPPQKHAQPRSII
jgi:hypothetical protein